MSETSTKSSGGVGFLGLLTIVFIVLKLTHQIYWSWWWVLSPLWLPFVIIVAFIAMCLVIWLASKML